jgi:hypothetical protein
MRATPHRFTPGAYSATDPANGRMYTVQGDRIERHHYRHGRVTLVLVDPAASPELAARIMAAIETTTTKEA